MLLKHSEIFLLIRITKFNNIGDHPVLRIKPENEIPPGIDPPDYLPEHRERIGIVSERFIFLFRVRLESDIGDILFFAFREYFPVIIFRHLNNPGRKSRLFHQRDGMAVPGDTRDYGIINGSKSTVLFHFHRLHERRKLPASAKHLDRFLKMAGKDHIRPAVYNLLHDHHVRGNQLAVFGPGRNLIQQYPVARPGLSDNTEQFAEESREISRPFLQLFRMREYGIHSM